MADTLTVDRLKELLTYEPETGIFRWRVTRARTAKAGDIAGAVARGNYTQIKIDGHSVQAARLAVLYMTGEYPEHEVDHKNLDRQDDRWENLREATPSQNCGNRSTRRDSLLGVKGVQACKDRYRAKIQINGKRKHLGYFATIADASAAYAAAANKLFGEFARASGGHDGR
jgi:HNH endonuclease